MFYVFIVFILCTAFNPPVPIKLSSASISDYRDAYTGNYLCSLNSTIVMPADPPIVTSGTVIITVTKDVQDSVVQLSVGSNLLKFKLKNNHLLAFPEGRWGGRFFASDSILLNSSYGRASSSYYIGKKTIEIPH